MHFLDTNVLLYAASLLPEEANKRSRARVLLTGSDIMLSVQVLQEFYHQATRATRPGRLSHDDAIRFVEPLLLLRVEPVTLSIFRDAVSISRRYRLSYWDGAILAAARAGGFEVVYSEDMSAGQDYDGVRVVNPFAGQ